MLQTLFSLMQDPLGENIWILHSIFIKATVTRATISQLIAQRYVASYRVLPISILLRAFIAQNRSSFYSLRQGKFTARGLVIRATFALQHAAQRFATSACFCCSYYHPSFCCTTKKLFLLSATKKICCARGGYTSNIRSATAIMLMLRDNFHILSIFIHNTIFVIYIIDYFGLAWIIWF